MNVIIVWVTVLHLVNVGLIFPFLQALKEKELGNEAYKKREFAEAAKHYDKAIELDPTNIIFYNNKAGLF